VENLAAAANILTDREGDCIEITHVRFELAVESFLFVVVEYRGRLELGLGAPTLGISGCI